MSVPNWYEAVLLALAAWRTFQLIAEDGVLDRPRRYVTSGWSETWKDFLSCSHCLGAWCALGWWVAWQIWPEAALVAATPFVLSAGVIAADKVLSPD